MLVDVDHTMWRMTEETFGPTLPIMKVRDEEEAIKLANDSPYGLGASVFGKDVGHAEAVARRIDAGAVCVNDALVNYSALELPMGGCEGLGPRHAPRRRRHPQVLPAAGDPGHARCALKKDLHMYPYNAKMTGRLSKLFRFLYGRGDRG